MTSESVSESPTKKASCCEKPPDFLGGILFVVFGIILLFNNFSIIPWTIWSVLVIFWPVILVLIGLEMVSGNTWILKIATTAIGVAIIALISAYSLGQVDSRFRENMYYRFPIFAKILQIIPDYKNMKTDFQIDQYFGKPTNRI